MPTLTDDAELEVDVREAQAVGARLDAIATARRSAVRAIMAGLVREFRRRAFAHGG
jgi:hypothetical protein